MREDTINLFKMANETLVDLESLVRLLRSTRSEVDVHLALGSACHGLASLLRGAQVFVIFFDESSTARVIAQHPGNPENRQIVIANSRALCEYQRVRKRHELSGPSAADFMEALGVKIKRASSIQMLLIPLTANDYAFTCLCVSRIQGDRGFSRRDKLVSEIASVYISRMLENVQLARTVHDAEHRFTTGDVPLRSSLAEQATVTLQRRREQDHRHFLLESSRLVAEANDIRQGLNQLTQMLRAFLMHAISGILLLDEDENRLTVDAAAAAPKLGWEGVLGKAFLVDEWNGLRHFLKCGRIACLIDRRPADAKVLKRLTQWFGLKEPLRSLILIRFSAEGSSTGLLALGDVKASVGRPFNRDEIKLISATAQQISALIHKLSASQANEEYRRLLDDLDEYSRSLLIHRSSPQLEQSVARLGADLLKCPLGCVFENLAEVQALKLIAVHGRSFIKNFLVRHGSGIVGTIALTGTPTSYNTDVTAEEDPVLQELGFRAVAAAPLRYGGQLLGVLIVGDVESRLFSRPEIEVLHRFAKRAAIALASVGESSPEHRMTRHLNVLHSIREYMQKTDRDLDCILRIILASITASYGLGFNRAAILLADEKRQLLLGAAGVGQTNEADAHSVWERDRQLQLDDLSRHIDLIERGADEPTDVGTRVRTVILPINAPGVDPVSDVFHTRQTAKLYRQDLVRLPRDLANLLQPTRWLLLVPLVVRNEALGILAADREFVEDLDPADENSLITFAGLMASAIEMKRLQNFRSLYAASRRLVSESDPQRVIDAFLEDLPGHTGARAVKALFADARGRFVLCLSAGMEGSEPEVEPNPDDFSIEVLRTGYWRTFEDIAHGQRIETALRNHFGSAVCLPMVSTGTPVGVLWVYYSTPRHFSREELETLSLHAQHLASAYGNAERIRRMKMLEHVSADVSRPVSLDGVRHQIVNSALTFFDADFAVLWSYDAERSIFLSDEVAAAGFPIEGVAELRRHPPMAGHTTDRVLAKNWFAEQDITKQPLSYMTEETRGLLMKRGIVAFQAGRLRISDEVIGVLYLSYDTTREFSQEDKITCLTFCDFCALGIKKATLFQQLQTSITAVQEVARKAVLEDLDVTLHSIANGVKAALDCTSVVLYAYDSDSDTVTYPPTWVGVQAPDAIQRHRSLPQDSLVRKLLLRDQIYPVSQPEEDEFLRSAPFRKREGVMACVVVPMRAADRKVGIIFVNYSSRRRFLAEELIKIEFFANQAATAIRNAQLFKTVNQKLKEQTDLADLSHALLESLNLQDTLDRAVEAASRILRAEFSNLVLEDLASEGLIFAAALGYDAALVGTQRLERGTGSHAGYTMQQGVPVAVEDLKKPTKRLPFQMIALAEELGIRSALGVPIFRDQKPIGALLVQSTSPRIFTEADKRMLQLIADQTAIAITAARQYQMLERRSAHLQALANAGKILVHSRGTFDRDRILSEILGYAVSSILPAQRRRFGIGILQLYNRDRDEATITAVRTVPTEAQAELTIHLGQVRNLEVTRRSAERIGTTGRVILTGESKLLSDVNISSDYVAFHNETRSEIAVAIFEPNASSDGRRLILGAISLETDLLAAFDAEDLKNLEAMARLAEALILRASLDEETEHLLREKDNLNRKLQDLDRRKTEWIRFVSHELRTPLKPLQALLEDQLEGKFGFAHEKLRSQLDHSLEMLNQQSHLVENLLARVRIEGGINVFSPAPANIAAILKSVYKTFVTSASRKHIEFTLSPLESVDLTIVVDARKIEHAISNLVSNALKFTPNRGKVTISAAREDNNITIRVRDTGRGVPSEMRNRLFDLHFQAKPADAAAGIGLGLTIVKTFVEMHGGQVGFQSTRAMGTEFWFSIPTTPPAAQQISQLSPSSV